jgi:ion channel
LQRILLSSPTGGGLPLTGNVLSFAFDAFIVGVIFHRVFFENDPTKEAIFGALCIYLLMGFSFSSIFGMLTKMQPFAFYLDPAMNAHSVPDHFDLIYYSFATLTCVGATGMSPVTSQARSVSVIESLVGILYIAVLISRLLNAYHAREIRSASLN